MKLTLLLVFLGIATIATGCAAVSDALKTTSESELALRAAVAEKVGGEAHRAVELIEAMDAIDARLSHEATLGDGIPINEFQARSREAIDAYIDSPGLRIVAKEYARRAGNRLANRVEAGTIPEDEILYLRTIVDTARDQAKHELERLERPE